MKGRPRLHGRRLVWVLALLLAYAAVELWPRISGRSSGAGDAAVAAAFESKTYGRMLKIEGVVERLLADDLEGSRHQRFIVRLASGRTLLISHNIDLAPRVPLATGDRVSIRGQYEWNERGGLLHWTHHDPRRERPGGWIEHRDRRYD